VAYLVQIRPWGALGKWVKCNENFIYLFIYTFFHELTYWSDPSTDLHKDVPFAVSLILLLILEVKYPQIFGPE